MLRFVILMVLLAVRAIEAESGVSLIWKWDRHLGPELVL